jgi:hypothetical protein
LRGGGEPLRAPLTAATCLWYRTVAKHVDFGYPFPPFDWLSKPIVEEESTTMFVDDDSGSVLVHAAGARFSLVDMRQGWYQDPPRSSGGDAARRFLERYAVSVDRSYGPGEARRRGQRAPDVMSREPYVMYRESVLRAGETVALLGRPFMEPDPAGSGIGSRTPPIRIVFGGVAGAIMISNEPGVF